VTASAVSSGGNAIMITANRPGTMKSRLRSWGLYQTRTSGWTGSRSMPLGKA
jgi:hypothetical protein